MRNSRLTMQILSLSASFGIVAGVTALAIPREQTPPLEYGQVANWPDMPREVKAGGISAVAADSNDNIYLLRRIKPYVMVFDQTGKYLRSWDGTFKTPHGLRIDREGNVWIADMANHLVQKFSSDGKLLLTLGQKDKRGLAPGLFNKPADVAIGPEKEIYIADGYGNSRIAKYSPDGAFVKDWGKFGKATSEFNIPHVVFLDQAKRVLVGDRENLRVQIFDRNGKFLEQWRDTGAPYGLYLFKDRVYLADGRTGTIRVLDKDGKLLARWESSQTAKETPHWICVDSQGAVYIGFVAGEKVQKWLPKA